MSPASWDALQGAGFTPAEIERQFDTGPDDPDDYERLQAAVTQTAGIISEF